MKVAVIGGTGFVGSYLVDELVVERGHEPALLVRSGSESNVVQRQRCRLTPGDVQDSAAVRATLQDCEAAICNIGLLYEFFPISRGQIAMLLEGNTCDSTAVFEQFGVTPIRFNEQSLAYLRQK